MAKLSDQDQQALEALLAKRDAPAPHCKPSSANASTAFASIRAARSAAGS